MKIVVLAGGLSPERDVSLSSGSLIANSLLESSHEVLTVHKTLRLGGYSRIDFILDNNNEFICLEANTLPGMTPTSLLPQEAAYKGITYTQLCETIALLAL